MSVLALWCFQATCCGGRCVSAAQQALRPWRAAGATTGRRCRRQSAWKWRGPACAPPPTAHSSSTGASLRTTFSAEFGATLGWRSLPAVLARHALRPRVPTSVAGCLSLICEIASGHLCKSRLTCLSVPLHRLQLADVAVQPLPATACPVAFALSCALDTRAGGVQITAQPQPPQPRGQGCSYQQQPQPAAAPFLTASIACAGPLPIMPGVRAAAAGSRLAAAAQRSGASDDSARYSSAVLAAAADLLAIAGLGRRLASGGAAATVERPQQPHSQDAGKCLDCCLVFRSHTWRQCTRRSLEGGVLQ